MSKIAVIAYETAHAVCSSMMMHVDMMSECGHDITLVISDEVNEKWFEGYAYKREIYSSRKKLKEILYKKGFDKVWCTNSVYVLYLKLIGINLPIYLWMQGDTPAESYLAHHSKIRRYLLQCVVGFSFRKVAGIVYVSESMKDYYDHNYRKTPDNSIIVPCLSEFGHVKCSKKRMPNSFVYIGGLSVWQCFDEILNIYKNIRTRESVFHIITLNTEIAKSMVKKIIGDTDGIEIYGITDRTKIPDVLNQFQYGFLIRKNNVVNLVSSPIKFLEYLSCGVNVIMTDAIPSYADIVNKYGVGTVLSLADKSYYINAYSSEAKQVYNKLFNRKTFVDRYQQLLR